MVREPLTFGALKLAANEYASRVGDSPIPELYGVTDGKAVGTYIEHGFNDHISGRYDYVRGNAAKGVDFPALNTDLKVTSIKQPQSSCPFANAAQKVYGLGYHLLVMVYEKLDAHDARAAILKFHHVILIDQACTADYQITRGIRAILDRDGNVEDLDAYLQDRNLPLDELSRRQLAERLVAEPPSLGSVTMSNALQWRLQYGHAIRESIQGGNSGVEELLA